jgi:hypothetical protein
MPLRTSARCHGGLQWLLIVRSFCVFVCVRACFVRNLAVDANALSDRVARMLLSRPFLLDLQASRRSAPNPIPLNAAVL